MIFDNCVFKSAISINYCKTDDFPIQDFREEREGIQFLSGEINRLDIIGNNISFGILFKSTNRKPLIIKVLNFKDNVFTKAGITFRDVEFIKDIESKGDIIKNSGISFNNCNSTGLINIFSIKTPSLSFTGEKSVYKNDIKLWGGEVVRLIWYNGKFYGNIDISCVKNLESLSITETEFDAKFRFKRKDPQCQINNSISPKKIWIQEVSFINGFMFSGDMSKSEELTMIFSEKSSGIIDFRKTYFKKVTLKGNNINSSVFLRDCSYCELIFTKLYNRTLISLINNKPESNDLTVKELKIENSYLGNTEFYDFDFSIYPKVRIINSRLDTIFTYGVKWFSDEKLFVDEKENSHPKFLSQKREIYRQLKLASEKQSDRITALKFKAREVQAHYNLLRINKILSNNWFKYWGDIASINLGKTNDHGQNWIKPLILIIGITLAFYPFLMILSDPEITFGFNWTEEGWNLFCGKFVLHSHVIPQLFNPARRLLDLFGNTNSFVLQLLDALHRIFLTFFIFQIVSAFRKFVK